MQCSHACVWSGHTACCATVWALTLLFALYPTQPTDFLPPPSYSHHHHTQGNHTCATCNHSRMNHFCWWNRVIANPIKFNGYSGACAGVLVCCWGLAGPPMLLFPPLSCVQSRGWRPRHHGEWDQPAGPDGLQALLEWVAGPAAPAGRWPCRPPPPLHGFFALPSHCFTASSLLNTHLQKSKWPLNPRLK